jgi:hypothetical protein
LIGSCTLVPGVTLEVVYLIWKVSCLETVVAHLECVIGKLKLSVDVVPLGLEAVVLLLLLLVQRNSKLKRDKLSLTKIT